jgi:hypothetical protein
MRSESPPDAEAKAFTGAEEDLRAVEDGRRFPRYRATCGFVNCARGPNHERGATASSQNPFTESALSPAPIGSTGPRGLLGG